MRLLKLLSLNLLVRLRFRLLVTRLAARVRWRMFLRWVLKGSRPGSHIPISPLRVALLVSMFFAASVLTGAFVSLCIDAANPPCANFCD